MATVDSSSECNLPAFVNPPVSNPSEFVHSKHPSTWDEAFPSTATALSSSPEQVRLQIASWNANSLNPHIYEAQALGMDILAIQEARISQDVVPGRRASLSKNGYRLFHGTLPSFKLQGHNRKTLHIDQTIPGVAFIVKQHIPVQEVVFEDMQHWESRGRFSALKVFINNKWVLLFNAYAPTQNSTPFLNDITHFLSKHAHTDCVFFADINACSREGEFVQEMCSLGWFPLTINTPSSFFTFKHSSGSTSCIDTIMVTDQLKEEVSPIQQKPVLKKGHVAITCSIHQHDTQKPSWEIFHKVCYEDPGDAEEQWRRAYENFCQSDAPTNIEEDWTAWCHAFQKVHNATGHCLGKQPAFRIRDSFRKNQLIDKLQQAIRAQDSLAQQRINDRLKQFDKNQIRKWQKNLQPKGQKHSDWLKHLFRWVRAASPPMPACIESTAYGKDGYTTSLVDSLNEIQNFFGKVYKTADFDQAVLEQNLKAVAFEPDQDSFCILEKTLTKIIRNSDASKAPGIDGLQVKHYKNLPPSAIKFLAKIFSKAIHVGQTPSSWLNCKMSCIPKRQGKVQVKDLRPLTIAPVAYRLFCKTLLSLHENCQLNIPANSIGGVKGRSGHSAWLPATIHCEATWRKVVESRRALQGVAIDTEKFFDNIQQSDACEALRYIGIPTDVIQAWQFMIQRIKRFASFNGAIATVGFHSAKGLPQGGPLSMLAAAAFLGKWTNEMPNQNLLAKVFVDDRLLLGFCNESLLLAFHTTELWDTHHGFSTCAKTTAFGTSSPQDNLWWMNGFEVKRDNNIVYLGVPLPFQKMKVAKFFEPLLQQCSVSLNKIIRAKLTHEKATTVIARKIVPMLCYAASVVRPTKAQINSIKAKIFEATSNRRCQTQLAHTIFCEKAHMFDPEVAMIYHNLRFWRKIYVEHLDFVELLNDTVDHIAPCKHSLFGPVTLLLADVSWFGCSINAKDGVIIRQDQTHLSFKSLDKQEFLHEIRQLIRCKLLSDLGSKHAKWDGVQNANLDISCKLLRKLDTSCTYRVPLIRLLTDAHATPERLF